MDYFPQGNVLDAMKTHKVDFPCQAALCTDIAKCLSHLQRENVIHMDLGLRNFLMDTRSDPPRCVLTDFGLSCRHPVTKKVSQLAPRWASPKLIQTRIPTFESDLWAAGVCYWEIFTLGKRPYPNLSQAEVIEKLKKNELRPNVDDAWPVAKVMDEIFDGKVDIKDTLFSLRKMKEFKS